MAAKRKRKASPAQRRALAKGRAALARKRVGKKRTTRKKAAKRKTTKRKTARRVSGGARVLVLPEGTKMAGRKRKRKRKAAPRRRRRYSGAVGMAGAPRRRRRTRRRYYGGAAKSGAMMAVIMDGAAVLGGAVAGSFAAGALPVPAKFKPFLPLAGGVLLNMMPQTRKTPMLRMAGIGMVVISGMSLIRQFAPQIPLMTGEVEDELLGARLEFGGGDELDALLGQMDESEVAALLGESEDFGGEDDDDDMAGFDDDDDMLGADSMYITAADM